MTATHRNNNNFKSTFNGCWTAIALIAFLASSGHAQTIIDDHFDGPEVSGWIGTGNTRTFDEQNITQEDSIITSEVVASQSNTNRGIVSEASFEPSATGGFTITFVAPEVGGNPGANGYFIGIVRDTDIFHRDPTTKNFGLAFFGQDPRTSSVDGFGLVYGDNNGSASSDFQLANSDDQGDVDRASFTDGFTAEISVTASGWSYEITGLLDLAGEEKTFSDEGTWDEAGTSFDELFPADDTWHAIGAIQVVAATTYSVSFDRITVVGGAGSGGGSGFQIVSLDRGADVEDPSFIVTWTSRPNRFYNMEFSLDLTDWVELEDGLPSDGETTEFIHNLLPNDADLVGAPQLYYRVRETD